MIFGAARLFPVSSPPVTRGAIRVRDGRIVSTGTVDDLRRAHPLEPAQFFPGTVMMPGLVNTHTHLEYSVFRHLAKATDFPVWIRRLVNDSGLRNRFWGPSYWLDSAVSGARQALASGTTTVGDIVTFGSSPEAAAVVGIRMRAFVEAVALTDQTCDRGIDRIQTLLAAHSFGSAMLRPGLAPHSIYTLSTDCLSKLAALSARRALPLAVHVAESPAENDLLSGQGEFAGLIERWGLPFGDGQTRSFVSYLGDVGLVGPGTILVHGLYLDDEDLALAKNLGAVIAACPRSNATLRCGVPPLARWRQAGLPFAYGTDSLASTPDMDLFQEARIAGQHHPEDSASVLRRLTLGGAEALAMDDITGSLATGKEADFICLAMEDASALTEDDIVVRASAARVDHVYVSGRMVYNRRGSFPPSSVKSAL